MSQRPLDRVVWSEGMLMSPQHLQQQERFLEGSVSLTLATLHPVPWGVASITIDEAALRAGQFQVTQFFGIFPGGTAVSAGNDTGRPPARSLDEHFRATSTSLEAHLAIPAWRDKGSNFGTGTAESAATRFRQESRTVVDLAGSNTEVAVAFGKPNLTIIFGPEAREDFETLKIAEIVRDSTGAYQLNPSYVPPCVHLAASRFLAGGLESLLNVMIAKQRLAADARRQRDASTVEFNATDVTHYLLVSALGTHIPIVQHLLADRTSSPLAAYLALVQLAGQLSAFAGQVDPSTFPRFNHLDQRGTFEPLLRQLHGMLDSAIRERTVPIPLEARRDGMWIGTLKDERLAKCSTFVLAVESQASEQDVANRLPGLSKIASWKQISTIVQSATPGVPLSPTHRPPPEVPIRPGLVYFTLTTTDRHWRSVMEERTIALYAPPPFDPSRTRLTLVGVPTRQ